MSFKGFPKDTTAFLAELAQNNNREWFTANKSDYKTYVEAPAKAFLEAVFAPLSDLVNQPMGGKVFRIYRDVRFSKDKTPYNAHIRMSFYSGEVAHGSCGLKPAFFFSLEPREAIMGAGSMGFPKPALEAYRTGVADEKSGVALAKLLLN